MSHGEVTSLRDRELKMLRSSRRGLLGGEFDTSDSMTDQAVQPYLKSVIFELTGKILRVHKPKMSGKI